MKGLIIRQLDIKHGDEYQNFALIKSSEVGTKIGGFSKSKHYQNSERWNSSIMQMSRKDKAFKMEFK